MMMTKRKYTVEASSRYKKELRKMLKRGADESKIIYVIDVLASGESLPPRYEDHPLHGMFQGLRECHITPDWVLVYRIDGNRLILALTRTGTHAGHLRNVISCSPFISEGDIFLRKFCATIHRKFTRCIQRTRKRQYLCTS